MYLRNLNTLLLIYCNFHVQDFLLFRHSSQNTNTKEDKLIDVCKALSLPPCVQIEINFFKEYLLLMAPIAKSIDILQLLYTHSSNRYKIYSDFQVTPYLRFKWLLW
jgi:hypothetical protein